MWCIPQVDGEYVARRDARARESKNEFYCAQTKAQRRRYASESNNTRCNAGVTLKEEKDVNVFFAKAKLSIIGHCWDCRHPCYLITSSGGHGQSLRHGDAESLSLGT
jgi:hypothetical protein